MSDYKEYLEKQPDGTYTLVLRGDLCKDDDIEVPEGAECAILDSDNNIYFWKSNLFIGGIREDWVDMGKGYDANWYLNEADGVELVWQRATHPEELPFIDDEPKYTDDEVKYMDENGQGRLQSINDQYAEIEQVRQHRHYFKDVSNLDEIDVYMVLKLFNVTDPCLQHIAKKALCAGQRGHKDFKKDLQDILDTAKRAVEINNG